jgi:hypothetical protein
LIHSIRDSGISEYVSPMASAGGKGYRDVEAMWRVRVSHRKSRSKNKVVVKW